MRHGVLGQKRRLEPDLGANPFTFAVRCVWRVIAAAAAAELGAEVGTLNLIEVMDLAPGGIAHRAGNVNLKSECRHKNQRRGLTGTCGSGSLTRTERIEDPPAIFATSSAPPSFARHERVRDPFPHDHGKSRMREPLVQHEVHNHACNGNIHPKRPGPARNGAMLFVTRFQSAIQRYDSQRNNNDGQGHMRDQNRKINRPRPTLAQKENIPHLEMEEEVASQKQRRRNYGRDHACAVRGDPAAGNQSPSREQQYRAGSVEGGVQGREEGVLFGDRISDDQAAGLMLWKIWYGGWPLEMPVRT